MANTPTDIANQALDASGIDFTLGDIAEGTRPAQVCLRWYGECFRQLLRAAPWSFARREVPLVLLADASGQTASVGTIVPSGFVYEYQYPTDCARVRYIPWHPNIQPYVPSTNIQPSNASSPQTTVSNSNPLVGTRIIPARFLITNDPNYPPSPGQNYQDVQGVSPTGRVVILTNVKDAKCVYTTTPLYPSMWDHMFRQAMVAYLASCIAFPLAKDKKFGMEVRNQQIMIAKQQLSEARANDGQEGWHNSDLSVDWMQTRFGGGGSYYGGVTGANDAGPGGYGCWGSGWVGSCGFANGSAF